MSLLAWFLVIFLTAAVAFLLGHLLNRGAVELDRIRLLDQLDQATANVQLPRAGRLELEQTFAPVPWEMTNAAYALGQQRADQDDVTREVNAIFAEIEGNPQKWRHG